MTTRKLILIWLGSMLMIVASTLIVERYFPSHAKNDPPVALKPGGSDNFPSHAKNDPPVAVKPGGSDAGNDS